MMPRLLSRTVPVLLALLLADAAHAQLLGRIRDRVRSTVEREVEDRADRAAEDAVEALFEAGEDAVRCLFTDAECIRRAAEAGQDVVLTDDDGRPVDPTGAPVSADDPEAAVVRAAGAAAAPGEGAWANYDFVPGHRPLFVEDFEAEYVGDVPRRLDFQHGVMEVVAEDGPSAGDGGANQLLRVADNSAVAIPLPEALPERFTIELDLYSGDDWNSVVLGTGPADDPTENVSCFQGNLRNHSAAEFRIGSFFETGVASEAGGSSLQNQAAHEQAMVPIRIAVDGSYVKMYVGESRVANVPNADVQRTDRVLLTACGELAATDDGRAGPVLIDNVRIAAGGRAMIAEQLLADGRMALGGLLFDTASARLRPESTPTLQDLLRALQQTPDLRLRVEGHTDGQGAADANRRLSQQRAEAVVAWLVGQGVDAGRLEAAGLGPDEPVGDNATPEGRAQNRRVEIVRL